MKALLKNMEIKVKNIMTEMKLNNKIKDISKKQNVGKINKINKKQINGYWNSFISIKNYNWHNTYNSVCEKKYTIEKYIPENHFYRFIERSLNNYEVAEAYGDKNYYNKIFNRENMPKVMLRSIHGRFYDEDYKLIESATIESVFGNKKNPYIIKPSIDSQGGENVKKLEIQDKVIILDKIEYYSLDSLTSLFGENYLVQEMVEQHELLSSIYPYSLNTIRIITFRINNEIKSGSAVLRFGDGKRIVDNKGIACGIKKDGKINNYGTYLNMDKTSNHPLTKKNFAGLEIPHFEQLKTFVKKMHLELYYFDMISWDIAIDKQGNFKMIEYNLKGQEINFHQINNGPLFGDYTNEILESIFSK